MYYCYQEWHIANHREERVLSSSNISEASMGPKFGESIKCKRLEMRKTLAELSTEVGIDKSVIALIENGMHFPTPDERKKIENFFK